MNTQSIGSQTSVQLYKNNQADTTQTRRAEKPQTNSSDNDTARLEISAKARELQAQNIDKAKEQAAVREQAARSNQTSQQEANPPQSEPPPPAQSRQPIDLIV